MTLWKRFSILLGLLVALASLATLGTAPAFAAHFPWDQGHDTFRPDPGDDDTDPGDDEPCQEGSPFQAATGNFIHSEQDLFLKGLGLDVDISRTYNSRDMRSGQFGHGWTFTYDLQAVQTTDGAMSFAVCRTSAGHRERYTANADGSFTSPSHLSSSLARSASGTLVLREKDGSSREYGSDGRLTAIVDRFGNRLAFSYDGTGFLDTITDTTGRNVRLTKGPNGKVASIQDWAGRILRYEYDAAGNLVRFTDAEGNATQYSYDSAHNLTQIRSPRGDVVQNVTYDTTRRVTSFIENGATWTVTYFPTQKRTTKRNSQGHTWTLFYNDNGVVYRRTNPLGRSVDMSFDANLNIASMTNENGRATTYQYDASGNPLTVTDAKGHVTAFTYNPAFNQIASIRDPQGQTSRFEHDANGNIVRMIDAAGVATNFTYDARGVLSAITDPFGNGTQFTTDAQGNPVQVTDPSGNVLNYVYDALGNVASLSNAQGTTSYAYNENGLLVQLTDAAGNVTRYGYDANSNLVSVTDAEGNETSFEYDAFDRLTRITDALGQITTFSYDSRGNLAAQVDAKGQTTTFTYDALDRLTQKTTPDNAIRFTYDNAGNPLTIVDNDSSLSFTYDELNRLTRAGTLATAAQPATSILYTYDANGNRLSMTDPQGGVTSYVYDSVGRLRSVTNPLSETTAYTYDQLSRRTRVALANGVTNNMTYDAVGRLASLRWEGPAAPALPNVYQYNTTGNLTQIQDADGVNAYTYDSISQLVAALHPQAANVPESYAYDGVGNRTSSHLSSIYRVDAGNRLTSDDTFTYAYDANGNLARKTETATGAVTAYAYDAENQLIRIDFPNGTFATYRYDGLGRRIEKNVNGQAARYIYDDEDILLELDGANAVVARYTHNPEGPGVDDPISVRRGGASYFYQLDELGSVIALSNAAGQVVQTYTYDSYGRIVEQTGSIPNPFTFTAREYDAESGLYFFRARYYDPSTGRFIQKDPLGFTAGDTNLYAYVFNNPANWIDPLGLQVGAPGFWESFIPVWGSGRQAIHDFQCGRWGWGLFNTAMAVSDAFLVGSAVKAIGKGAWKVGSHTWGATRKWYGQTGRAAKGQPVHHWAIERNGPIGKHVPDAVKNQPWNLNPMPDRAFHDRVHGKGPDPFGPLGRWWHGTPDWAKNAEANAAGRAANGARGGEDCNCNE